MKWDEWRGNLDGSVIVMRIKNLISFRGYKLDLHKFVGEDSDDCFHTHPAKAIRFIIRGGYIEEIEGGKLEVWKAGMIGIVQPELSHRVSSIFKDGALTLWFRFPKTHESELRGDGWQKQRDRIMNSGIRQFQVDVAEWLVSCFGKAIATDTVERNQRFIEEALELVQACGGTREDCHMLVDYVFDRPVGDPPQEVGGVMITLAALCFANNFHMDQCGPEELVRIWGKQDEIREKQRHKPRNSPYPEQL